MWDNLWEFNETSEASIQKLESDLLLEWNRIEALVNENSALDSLKQ